MAELSRNFLKGRMNKDFDERIVPNGEYRDALNLQIATSEDSNIGAAQNLKGNVIATESTFMPLDEAKHSNALTVGSYADESNKYIYNFVHKASDLVANGTYGGLTRFTGVVSDCIIEYNRNEDSEYYSSTPIVTDVFEVRSEASEQLPDAATGLIDITKIQGLPTYYDGSKYRPLGIRQNMRVQLVSPNGEDAYGVNNYVYVTNVYSGNIPATAYIKISQPLGSGAVAYTQNLINNGYVFKFTAERVLNFTTGSLEAESNTDNSLTHTPRGNMITAINKVDDTLYFTDSRNEPKRIPLANFQRETYSDASGVIIAVPSLQNHSYFHYLDGNNDRVMYPMIREYITVIRPNPLTAPDISIQSSSRTPDTIYNADGIDTGLQYSAVTSSLVYRNVDTTAATPPASFNLLTINVGQVLFIFSEVTQLHWKENDIIDIVGQSSGFSASLKIVAAYSTSAGFPDDQGNDQGTYRSFKVELLSVESAYFAHQSDDSLNAPGSEVWFGTLREKDSIYEKDFISFAYRYKYATDEYSAIGPYSITAFAGGPYKYSPKDGFNQGMLNRATKINIFNYVSLATPEDVKEIEIIFKDHNSTNARVIKSIKRNTYKWATNGVVQINSEVFGNNLPSQQLTRIFDNVPRKANAQEFVGNRLMFGNYLENYDIKDASLNIINPNITSSIKVLAEQTIDLSVNADLTANWDGNGTYPFSNDDSIQAEDTFGLNYNDSNTIVVGTGQIANQANDTPDDEYHGITIGSTLTMQILNFGINIAPTTNAGFVLVPMNLENDINNVWNTNNGYRYQAPLSGTYNINMQLQINVDKDVISGNSPNETLSLSFIKVSGQEDFQSFLTQENVDNAPSTQIDHTVGGFNATNFAFATNNANTDLTPPNTQEYSNVELSGNYELEGGSYYAFYISGFNYDTNTVYRISMRNMSLAVTSPQAGEPVVGISTLPLPSVKSLRSYNLGMVYLDRYGRESTVMFDESENLFNSKSNASNQTRLNVIANHQAPYWATHYKYFVRELADEYYNVVLYKAYFNDTEGLYAWLSFNSADRNKISIDNYLIQKKKHGSSIPVEDTDAKWRVLDIVGEPETVTDNNQAITGISLGDVTFNASSSDISGKFFVKIQIDEAFTEYIGDAQQAIDNNNINQGACFEVESNNNNEIDLFYEISDAYPIRLNVDGAIELLKKNMTVKLDVDSFDNVPIANQPNDIGNFVNNFNNAGLKINSALGARSFGQAQLSAGTEDEQGSVRVIMFGSIIGGTLPAKTVVRFNHADGSYVKLITSKNCNNNTLYLSPYTHKADNNAFTSEICLPWYNCIAFSNGVESDRIRDDFNAKTIYSYTANGKISGFKASIPNEDYREQRQGSKIIFSQVKNESVGLNRTNEFLMAEPIVKSLNPEYGTIQKLYTRDNDLISFCESKVLRVLANKDALFNADGDPQLISSTNVLGQALPYAGDYGISKNPESFAVEEYRIYFADKDRGAICRLSRDGITAISDAGMKDFFNDNLRNAAAVIGSYDGRKSEYNITIHSPIISLATKNVYTVSYTEDVKGWTSFRSYIKESGLSLSNNYYTFKTGRLYLHDPNEISSTYNNFYGTQYTSTITPIFNDDPSVVKSFAYINYEGTQSKINAFTTVDGETDNEYYNLNAKNGWNVELINTDKQEGTVGEFIEKEGKWFNYIKGVETSYTNAADGGSANNNLDFNEITIQGIGILNNSIIEEGSSQPTEGFDVDLDFI